MYGNEPRIYPETANSHRFLDEAGDTTFFGKGKVPVIGQLGVSLSFAIGMVKFNCDLAGARKQVSNLQAEVANDRYLRVIPSVARKIAGHGFYFHATDDPAEVREHFFKLIDSMDCSCEVVVARKIISLFAAKHHGRDAEFYADVLSHLLKNKLRLRDKLVLNIAERGKSTKNTNLQLALTKSMERFTKTGDAKDISSSIVFNVQNHVTEPLLNVADYMCWAVQRVFERGETRYYDFLGEKIKVVIDLYDTENYERSRNYYRKGNRLTTGNRLSPPPP
jgi:hypothetical protein